jgi:hypothetical protein
MAEENAELGSNLFDEQSAPPAAKAKRSGKNAEKDAGWYNQRQWIVVEENAEIPLTGLPLSHNGDVVLLMPGEPVHLQNKYIEILDHAVISVPQLDGRPVKTTACGLTRRSSAISTRASAASPRRG